jgi:hypothetical protein
MAIAAKGTGSRLSLSVIFPDKLFCAFADIVAKKQKARVNIKNRMTQFQFWRGETSFIRSTHDNTGGASSSQKVMRGNQERRTGGALF